MCMKKMRSKLKRMSNAMQHLHFFYKFENRYWDFGEKAMKKGESTSNPSKIIITNIIFM